MTNEIPKNILVVDDDAEFLAFVATALEPLGYEIHSVRTGAEARALIKSRRFAMVLVGLRLPDISGLDVLGSARKADPLSVGIIMTTQETMDSALEALGEGVHDYLLKPCSMALIEAAVRRGMSHHRVKAALFQKTIQLEKMERLVADKNRLIQNVTHELKNPLTVVCGYSSFLLKQPIEASDPHEMRRNIQSINKNADRMHTLLDELQESTRLSNNKVSLDRTSILGLELVREAVENMRIAATEKHIALLLGRCEADLAVFADSKRIHQILSNLIANAIKFTPTGGTILVTVRRGDGVARFCVKDNGSGVSPLDLPHLFERFYQVDISRKSHKGLGLGLEICRSLVELHGGRIWADSFPEEGSSFFFNIPLITHRPKAPAKLKEDPLPELS